MENSELIIVHLVIAFSIALPAVLMKLVVTEYPNTFVGYRTPASVRSKEAWEFSQPYSANLLVWSAVLTLLTQVATFFTLAADMSIIVTTTVLVIGISLVIILTEIQLKKRFDKEGKPRSHTIIRGN